MTRQAFVLVLLIGQTTPCKDASYLTARDYTPAEHAHAGAGRLSVSGRQLYLDGSPFFMRGVTYAPTPPGDDPGWVHADYLSTAYRAMQVRDLGLMEEMGLNTIRLYGVGETEAVAVAGEESDAAPRGIELHHDAREERAAAHAEWREAHGQL